MIQASASTHQSHSHPQHIYSSNNPSGPRGSPCPPITISTSRSRDSTNHGVSWTGSVLQKLCSFLSPRKPSSSTETSPATPTSVLISNLDDGTGTSSAPRRAGEEFEKVFRYFDENGDGKISPSELCSCMRAAGEELSEADAEEVVESMDTNGDGLLTFDDFVKLVDVGGEEERARDLREAFSMYEMEGEGCITPKSLRRMLRRLGESKTIEECKVMIRKFDLDSDGVLSFDEFKLMML